VLYLSGSFGILFYPGSKDKGERPKEYRKTDAEPQLSMAWSSTDRKEKKSLILYIPFIIVFSTEMMKTDDEFTKMKEDAEKWNAVKGWFHEVCPFCGEPLSAEDLKNGWCHHCVEDDPGTFHPIKGKHLDEYVKRVYGDVKPLDPSY